ncbi:MAG: cupin domain-containing protein [Magnetococcales bacterium]|nr:cupin domain-containing protein [Magnetococcales bacterium]
MKIVSLSDLLDQPSIHNPEISKKILLNSGDAPHIKAVGQVTFTPGQVIPAHAHDDMHEIFMIRSGSGVIRINGAEHTLTSGSCTVVQPNEQHEVENTGSEPMLLIYFQIPIVATGSELTG